MAPQRKHAQKAWKVSNTIEEQVVLNIIEEQAMPNRIEKQAIVIFVAPAFQGMSWKVHFKFAYGHIRAHPYSPCENKDGFFLVNFFCNNT